MTLRGPAAREKTARREERPERKNFNRKGSRDSPSQLPEILVGMTRFELATP